MARVGAFSVMASLILVLAILPGCRGCRSERVGKEGLAQAASAEAEGATGQATAANPSGWKDREPEDESPLAFGKSLTDRFAFNRKAAGKDLSTEQSMKLWQSTRRIAAFKEAGGPQPLQQFSFVTLEGGSTQDFDSIQTLIEEVEKQVVLTAANPLMIMSARVLDWKEGDPVPEFRWILPVAPGTEVQKPLVVQKLPEAMVIVANRDVLHTKLTEEAQGLKTQITDAGKTPGDLMLVRIMNPDWPVIPFKDQKFTLICQIL